MGIKGQGLELKKNEYARFDVYMPFKSVSLVSDNELLRQTIECVLQTNKGEWQYDIEEGIDFRKILIKKPNIEIIKHEIRQAIYKIDESLEMSDFNYNINNRYAEISVILKTSDGEEIVISTNIE